MKNLSLYIVYLFVFFHYSVSARTILKNICIDIDSVQISRDWDRRGTYFLRGNDHWRHPRQSHRPTSCLCGRYLDTKKNGYRAIGAIDYSIIVTDSGTSN